MVSNSDGGGEYGSLYCPTAVMTQHIYENQQAIKRLGRQTECLTFLFTICFVLFIVNSVVSYQYAMEVQYMFEQMDQNIDALNVASFGIQLTNVPHAEGGQFLNDGKFIMDKENDAESIEYILLNMPIEASHAAAVQPKPLKKTAQGQTWAHGASRRGVGCKQRKDHIELILER